MSGHLYRVLTGTSLIWAYPGDYLGLPRGTETRHICTGFEPPLSIVSRTGVSVRRLERSVNDGNLRRRSVEIEYDFIRVSFSKGVGRLQRDRVQCLDSEGFRLDHKEIPKDE